MYKVKLRVKLYLFGLITKIVYDVFYGQNHTVAKLTSDGGGEPFQMYLEHKVRTFNTELQAKIYCYYENN